VQDLGLQIDRQQGDVHRHMSGQVTMSSEMIFAGDSFSGTTRAKDSDSRLSSLKVSAKRIGDCVK
jgi:hypothetical protein